MKIHISFTRQLCQLYRFFPPWHQLFYSCNNKIFLIFSISDMHLFIFSSFAYLLLAWSKEKNQVIIMFLFINVSFYPYYSMIWFPFYGILPLITKKVTEKIWSSNKVFNCFIMLNNTPTLQNQTAYLFKYSIISRTFLS